MVTVTSSSLTYQSTINGNSKTNEVALISLY